jgi:hypothetical protein
LARGRRVKVGSGMAKGGGRWWQVVAGGVAGHGKL